MQLCTVWGCFSPTSGTSLLPVGCYEMEAVAKLVCPCHIILVSFLGGSSLLQKELGWPKVVSRRVQNHFPATQAVVSWLVLSWPLHWVPFLPLSSALRLPACGGGA